MCGCLLHTLNCGPGLQRRHVPWLGNPTGDPLLHSSALNPLSHNSQGFNNFLFPNNQGLFSFQGCSNLFPVTSPHKYVRGSWLPHCSTHTPRSFPPPCYSLGCPFPLLSLAVFKLYTKDDGIGKHLLAQLHQNYSYRTTITENHQKSSWMEIWQLWN